MRRSPILVSVSSALLLLVAAIAGAAGIDEFLDRHWRRPLASQGSPPARFTAIERSLDPRACGTCHPAQLADWRTSLHARAMGAGVAGQLVEMVRAEPASVLLCSTCHAPLAEQAPLVRRGTRFVRNPSYDAALASRGVTCGACHVRGWERFGPPRRDGSLASAAPRDTLPHGGATRTPAFLDSAFCKSCHQFGPDGHALNGKPLENTYEEWKASAFAREGVHCQDCHMPDRRHRWRGIHDPDMVRSGLTIALAPDGAPRPGEPFSATLRVESTRVGHAFPTYVTPRVVLRGELLDARGRVIAGTRAEIAIERAVELDLSREIADTRLLPGEAATLEYRRAVDRRAARARFSVVVFPDAFYTRFFASMLEQGAGRGAAQIRQARDAARRSAFTVFAAELPVL